MSDRLDPDELKALWDFGDPAGSETRFRARLAETDPESVAAAELATQVARAQGLQGAFVKADATLDAIQGTAPLVVARLELERGRLRTSSGSPGRAIPHFRTALAYAEIAGNAYLAVDALHMLAIADTAHAGEWTRLGIARTEASDDPHTRGWRGPLHNNLGWSAFEAGDPGTALTLFERAREAFMEGGTPSHIHVAQWTVARCLRELGRFEEALTIQRRLAAEDAPDHDVDAEIALLETLLASRLTHET